MDEFSAYGNTLNEALDSLEKVIIYCREAHLSLSNIKCQMIMIEGIILGHHVSFAGIKVDPTKIEVIMDLPVSCSQKEVKGPRPCRIL